MLNCKACDSANTTLTMENTKDYQDRYDIPLPRYYLIYFTITCIDCGCWYEFPPFNIGSLFKT